ncbi:hypothetical protein AB1Y20_015313 [Prymnesium parvum]|uniref:Uncharacterized protein n=1 Tax=Prymnesium parvum TaxID=97485 RepID=A0AB34JY18_PRYPA
MPRSTSSAPASTRNSNSTQPSAASASPSSCGSPSSTTSAPSSHQTCTTPTVSLSRSDTDPSALHPITPPVPWWAVARDINANTLWRMHHDVLLATHASKPLTRACAEHLVSFVNLLSDHLSTTIYPQCSVDVECSAADGKTCWPLVRKGGPCTRAVAQTIGSAPLGVMTSWQIRRYAAGSDVNVLLLSPEPLWALERLAAALVTDPTIASCSIRASKQRGVYLHARMLTGMHVGVTVATNEESFDAPLSIPYLIFNP